MSYCASRYHTVRRPTHPVNVGGLGVGGSNPIRIQSMTTSDTQDVAATVQQSIALAEVGCEIVRITAPNVTAAKCLRAIRAQFTAAGFGHIPLVAEMPHGGFKQSGFGRELGVPTPTHDTITALVKGVEASWT